MLNNYDFLKRITSLVPSDRQISVQKMEFYAFIHYGINAFTNREWGDGTEDIQIFNPKKLNTDQWCESIKKAGMKGVIMTAKHHDGFCLWDTAYSAYSVMHSPYGQDIVAKLAESCKKYDIKLGIYLSPWDRNHQEYGTDRYNDYFCNQLTELLTNYGEIFSVWFDGACGEGPNGKKQSYDWERYYALIRKLQPNAGISVCGPDIRWCGNEAGRCRTSEWSVVPAYLADNEKIQNESQQEDDPSFRARLTTESEELGSREILAASEDLIWYPAEVNTSIRPGWFYHESEDEQVRTLDELTSIYLQSVGGNAMFLLNLPPHPDGYLHENDVKRLAEIGHWIETSFSNNLLKYATYEASSEYGEHEVTNIKVEGAYWQSKEEDISPWLIADAGKPITPKYLVLQEEITKGQRIESFKLSYFDDSQWKIACLGTVVGYKRICLLDNGIAAKKWKLEITSCRLGATLANFELY